MTSTIEYLALGAVAIVLIISMVQAGQLSGLNEKVSQQNATLTLLSVVGATAGSPGTQGTAPQQPVPTQGSSPSQQMVGGC